MMKTLCNRIRRLFGQPDPEAGFTLIELVVSAAAFTIICAGITTLLLTSLRIQKYTAVNTEYRESIRMIRTYVKRQAEKGKVILHSNKYEGDTFSGIVFTYKDSSDNTEHPFMTYRIETNAIYAGRVTEGVEEISNIDPAIKNIASDTSVDSEGDNLMKATIHIQILNTEKTETYFDSSDELYLYCPCGIEVSPSD